MPLSETAIFPRSIQAITLYGVFVLNAEGIIISWNKGSETVQGYSSEEVMGKPFAPLYGKQISKPAEYFNELLVKAREMGALEEEGWRQRKDGTYFWSLLAITPIYDADKKLLAYSIVSKDVTAKKLAGELPEITESLNETAVLASSNIMWYRSKRGEFVYPELQWEHFTGQAWLEHQGFGWLKMYPEEERGKVMAFWASLQDMDISMLYNNLHALEDPKIIKQFILRTKLWSKLHNAYRPVVISVVPVFSSEGEFKHWVGNEKDEYNMFVEKMRYKELSEKQKLILSSTKIGIWEYDIEKDQLGIDPVVAKFYGIDISSFRHTLSEARGKILAEDAEMATKQLKECIEYGKSYHVQFRIRLPDGSVRHIVEDGSAQFDTEGKIKRVLGSNWDITDTFELLDASARAKNAEIQREQQRKFIDTICHEMRNPLNGINGYIEELKEVIYGLEKVSCLNEESKMLLQSKMHQLKTGIEVITDCSNHQKEFIDQVLDLSELERNKMILNKQNFHLQDACRSVIAMHQDAIAAKQLSLKIAMPEEEIWVKHDENHFKRILTHIVLNAIHNTEEGGISFNLNLVSQADDKITFNIIITDTSVGYTTVQLSELFERFSPTTRYSFATTNKGPGLALVISNELSHLLGGHLDVSSETGHGNHFKLTFEFDKGIVPVVKSSFAPSSLVIAGAGHRKEERTILVVDDSKSNRLVLDRIIRKIGFKCIQAADGDEAVRAYDEHKPDLILMDIEMPGKNGFEATTDIRSLEASATVPILAVSAYTSEEYKRRAEEVGMNGFVPKPIDIKTIKQVISSALNLNLETPTSSLYTPTGGGAE